MADQNKADFQTTSTETIINLNEICRFCLSETKSNITINDKCSAEKLEDIDEDSIYNFVTRLKFVKMEYNENFPTKVCENCYGVINICNEFNKLCQKSDSMLRGYYENNVETKSPKILYEIPISDEFKNKPNYNTQLFTSNKIIINKSELNILDVNKQKLHLLSEKVKNAHTQKDIAIKNKQYTCLNTSQDLNSHKITKHNEKYRFLLKYQCENCSKSFSDEKKLKKHYKIIHKINEVCLDSRVNELVNIKKFVCFYCEPNMEFKYRDEFFEHLKLHNSNICYKNQNKTSEVKHESLLICNQGEESGNEKSNLIDLSNFINTLGSVVDSLMTKQSKKFKLVCKNCNPQIEFDLTSNFINHISTHHGLKLLKNLIIKNKNENWNCDECHITFTKKESFYYHMNEKHNNIIYNKMKCPEPDCCESFNTNRQLIQHGIIAHDKYYAYYHKVFKKILQSQKEEYNKEKNYECDICKKKYIYKTSLKKHIFDSHLEKSIKNPVVCSYCGKTVSSKFNLKSHIEFKHEALYVSCPICKKNINFRTIGKHYKIHKTNSDVFYSKNTFLCNLCGKILKSKRSFEDHQKLHKNIKDELCDICGRGFTTKKLLQIHKKTHQGISRKIFNCDQCDKVFSGRQTLNRHLLTHTGKKNFICEICSKCFYTLQELNRHVRYHKKEYRFDCQLCDMRFFDKSRFRHHMMKHRNIRPHKCQFCEKMFIVRGKMILHMAAKHNVEVEDRKGVWKDPKTYIPLDDLL